MNGRNILAAGLVVALGGAALAQFKPESAYRESPEVAEHYPDPQVAFTTPAFATGKTDFTSQAEMMAFLTALAARAPQMTLSIVAKSQEGRDMPALVFTRHGPDTVGKGQRPVVMLIGQQHGNEPAGGEAMLVLAERLGAGNLVPLLDAIDVVIIPRGNPDGADRFRRALSNGIDANRDHTQLRTPEIRAIAELFTRYRPDILLDCHEFTVAGRWVEPGGGDAPEHQLERQQRRHQPRTADAMADARRHHGTLEEEAHQGDRGGDEDHGDGEGGERVRESGAFEDQVFVDEDGGGGAAGAHHHQNGEQPVVVVL